MIRTGIIVGVDSGATPTQVKTLTSHLRSKYPDIEITVIGGVHGMCLFEFDDLLDVGDG